ncbi:MAG: aldo/keto reductase [Elusimicrobia bacterium]|nr:aldo/keto reductase [Elusimicrobiota bacterium]
MKLNPLGRSGLKVSAIGLGTMNFGADWHGIGAVDEKTARDLVSVAIDHGVNLIDTADIYGRGASESMLGRILGKRRRSKLLLATKVLGEMRPGDPNSRGLSRRHISEGLDDSLRRLKTDYVDLYMPHGWDPGVPLDETLEALHRAMTQGKVRALGCSNFSGAELQEALALAATNRWHRFEFDQVQYSLASRFIEGDLVPVSVASAVPVLAWSPLGGGFLTGKYSRPGSLPEGRRSSPGAFPELPEERLGGLMKVLGQVARLEESAQAQAAIGWLMGKPWVASVLVGARTVGQLKVSLTSRPLSAKSAAFLDKASELCAAG